MNDYVEQAARTDAPLTAELLHRLTNPQTVELLHAAMGMVTEAGELMDMLKKHIYANKPHDLVNAGEELGDELWYVAKALRAIQMTMADCQTMNINKLRLRFPDKFSEDKSLGRDVVAERQLLEEATESLSERTSQDNEVTTSTLSQRGQDWQVFASEVLSHIEKYTVPQYGDKGEDSATSYKIYDIKTQLKKYTKRMTTNARGEVEAKRDFLKIAHYASLGYQL